MSEDDSFVAGVYSWFYHVDATAPKGRSLARALAWFATPNARVVATRLSYGLGEPEHLLELGRQTVKGIAHLPDWDTAEEAEEYLRAVLARCTTTEAGNDSGSPR